MFPVSDSYAMPASGQWPNDGRQNRDGFFFLVQIVVLQAVTIAVWEFVKCCGAAMSRARQLLQKPLPSETPVKCTEAAAKPSETAKHHDRELKHRRFVYIGETEHSLCFHLTAHCVGLKFACSVRQLKQCASCKRKDR